MLPTPSGLLSETLVQVAFIFVVGSCCCYVIVHIRTAAIGNVVTSVVVPSVDVAVVVVTKSFGCSVIIKLGESLVFVRKFSKDAS